jgi:hypothetical protein
MDAVKDADGQQHILFRGEFSQFRFYLHSYL